MSQIKQLLCYVSQPGNRLSFSNFESVLWFGLVVCLSPLGQSFEVSAAYHSQAIVWPLYLLAALFAVKTVYSQWAHPTNLQLLVSLGWHLPMLLGARLVLLWGVVSVPMALLAAGVLLESAQHWQQLFPMFFTLLAASFAIMWLSATLESLLLSLTSSPWLVALLIWPLAVPVLIFGGGALSGIAQGIPSAGFWFLLAFDMIGLSVFPWIAAYGVRQTF